MLKLTIQHKKKGSRKGVKSVLDDSLCNVYSKIMSRPLHIEFPGAVYHVMNRGLNRNSIFLENKNYELFGETLEQGCRFFE
ncbi:MAG: hypothetical protein COV66_08145 [Nitrospinae bacterium CG11_big_fil_rev_8_21_14_0_20_45_15]|nr:MAG: hypothetical protein COV66_08145 [Nitrospinae bacterium CG11_big_fil_rev_8_21_14_0_20_45_15]